MDWTDSSRIARLLAAATVAVVALGACSVAGPRKSPLPDDGPTVEEIYRKRTSENQGMRAREALPLRPATEVLPGPVLEPAMLQLERRFARLPNPDLIMIVFPHLSRGKYPAPGYVTAFPMYERVEYLLPGEAGALRPDHRSTPASTPTASVPPARNPAASRVAQP
ncbi:MAG: TIGR03751 family conjugal transfer lipoprotein [Aromatoleum sp.]|jgi:conjugative transfer region lipoprotein (TIGR03751 family)|uniref:TIGR03751 family conjugal transfer lipoprotein n=1 Tax=Aromatoleum sp. TaxID=2307007 RepID=UPI002894AE19|nr:TIGR03751 family conjugal transfer lipoprotein [Aromatoleum sp.]MDT3671765.1 TIGR03751 family conjugal transfer lipoprotein [Aromatoleum sp.]